VDDAVDQSAEFPDVTLRLRDRAADALKHKAVWEPETFDLDEMQLDQLRALGYELP
jgi:hypothetical protein